MEPIVFKREGFAYPSDETFFFVDVETATWGNDRLCAVGSIIVKGGQVARYYSLINPHTPIVNSFIHGIYDRDVVDAPTLAEYWRGIAPLLGEDYIIVGHNISFDITALTKDLSRFGIPFCPKRKIDTMAVARDILYHFCTKSGDLRLNTLCDRLHIALNHHNAESDIGATKEVLETLLSIGGRDVREFICVR